MNPSRGEREVRERLFRSSSPHAAPRIGLEVEFLLLDLARRRPVAPGRLDGPSPDVGRTSLPVLRELAAAEGWEIDATAGLPRFRLPQETLLSFEPGGQIELATRPWLNLDGLDAHLRSTTSRMAEAFGVAGIGMLTRGLDPWTPIEEAGLHMRLPRYQRMSDHYDRTGPAGRRMMRQTAGVHVNLDFGAAPLARWERANALVPLLMAMFANSSRREGADRGWRSERSAAWRALDPSRTGVFGASDDPPADYVTFARNAAAFLFDEGAAAHPWKAHESKRSLADWRHHLTTLFPEVRPRGYLEIRCVDALPPELLIVPAAVGAAALYHPSKVSPVALGLLDPDRELLVRAGRDGLRDPELQTACAGLRDLVLDGLDRLGESFAGPSVRARVEAFLADFTARGRDPGHGPRDWVETPALRVAHQSTGANSSSPSAETWRTL